MVAIVNPIVAGVNANAVIPIVTRYGLVASPVATLTGSTGAAITLPVVPTIPAGTIGQHSRVRIQGTVQRTGANGTANLDIYLGTAGTTGDSRVIRIATAATTGLFVQFDTSVEFGTSTTSALSKGKYSINNSGTDNQFGDLSTNLNTAATMYVTFATNSANALDTFSVLDYRVWVEPV